ncbi:MAG: 2-oxo acid dehydrogenase subunit E2 [Actinomycetota bacterium]|nr:2-oxo acid dehydrogenase subunit E2 [Actinomycetota bacterium]
MPKEFRLGDPGEGIAEAEIVEVHVSAGDEVEEGDVVIIIETDKATTELPSPFGGEVASIEVDVGDVVEVGEVLMTFSDGEAPAQEEEAEQAEGEAAEIEAEAEAAEAEAAEPEAEAEEAEPEEAAPARAEGGGDGPVPASPATRRLARELGVDLREVEPTGASGRVTAEDVRTFEGAPEEEPEERPEERPSGKPLAAEAPELPDFSQWGETERVPLRGVRRSTARNMTISWSQVPYVTHFDVADVTALEAFRAQQADAAGDEDASVTLMILVMKAVVAALKQFPRFNASLDAEAGEIVLKRYYNLGVATATEDGLIVPVVRDVDQLSVAELAAEVTRLTERARAHEVGQDEVRGGTFTITNTGPIGGTFFTPIIRFPEVAILGMGRTSLQPVIDGDLEDYKVVARERLPLSLSYDHRVIDGADAARFVSFLVEVLGQPEDFLLRV